jgi:pilus assembly protein CpaB
VKSRLLAITLAAVLAVVGIVGVLAYVRDANDRAVNGLKAETVVWAKGPIAAGTSLNQAYQGGLLGLEKVPESSLTTAAVQSVTGAEGHKVVTSAVARGQVLLQNMLGASASNASASGFVIPKNMIAISIDVCVAEAVADYVTAGSNVAVFGTTISNKDASTMTPSCSSEHPILGTADLQSNQAATGLVLSKIQVLAVGQNSVNQSTSAGSSTTATTEPVSSSSSSSDVMVTVAVTQRQAEALILMCQVGIPYLALLGSNSPTLVPSNQFQSQDLFQAQP